MVELWRDPSGDVKLTTNSPYAVTPSPGNTLSSEDSTKIVELRKIVASLKSEIETVSRDRKITLSPCCQVLVQKFLVIV